MNKYRLLLSVLLFMGFPLLTGCWDRLEIEERGTVLGLAIDPLEGKKVSNVTGPSAKSDLPGYQLTAQVAIPGRIPLGPAQTGGERGEKPVWVISTTGKTIDDAMYNLQEELANKIFLGHLRIIIVNQKLAQSNGMHDIQDFFRRNAEIRRLAWLIISTGSARQAMEAAPKLERVPTLYLVGTMDHTVKMGMLPNQFLGNYWSTLSSKGRDPVLPLISVMSQDRIKVSGLAVFKGEKMVGSLDPMEVGTYLALTDVKTAGYGVAIPMPGDPRHSVIARVTNRRTTIKLRKEPGGVPSFDVYVRLEMNITEKTGFKKIDNQVIRQISEGEAKLLEKTQAKTIGKLKQLNADVIGLGETVRAEYPEYWAPIGTREKWDQDEFPKVPVRIHVEVDIRRTGMSAR